MMEVRSVMIRIFSVSMHFYIFTVWESCFVLQELLGVLSSNIKGTGNFLSHFYFMQVPLNCFYELLELVTNDESESTFL